MSTLKEAVSVLLGDLSRSQDHANHLTKELADAYRHDEVLQMFPVPNQQLQEADIELRYGIESSGPTEGDSPGVVHPRLSVFFDAERLARLPDHAVQRLHIRAFRFGTRWVASEDGEEHLIPEE